MNDGVSHDRRQDWFLWGIVLAAVSSIPFFVTFVNVFRGISQEKATGLSAVAGGATEGYATVGLVLTFILPVGAIVLLCKSFSGSQLLRKVFSLLFICWSVFLLIFFGVGAWMIFVQFPQLTGGPR